MGKFSDAFKSVGIKLTKKVKNNRSLYKQIGEISKEIIIERTRSGKGVNRAGGTLNKLPSLKLSTINRRQSLKRKGDLTGPGARPGKSALNRSGATLENIQVIPKSDSVEVRVDSEGEKVVRNTQKISSGYNFMTLSSSEIDMVNKKIKKIIK